MKSAFPCRLGAAACLLACSAGLQAQNAPLRNTPPAPAGAASAVASPTTVNGSFILKEVRFSPTRAVTQGELQQAVKPFIGRETDAAELSVISAAVRRLYEERGLGMAAIAFPGQDLTQGVLRITIVEPQVERVSIDTSPRPPISVARTEAVLRQAGVLAGKSLDLQALDRAMFTLNDWPGVSAKATLLPSGDEGRYGISIQTERRRAWDASIDADNHGSSIAGRYRLGTLLRWNNPAGIGDNLDLRLLASSGKGTTVGRVGYEAPVGATPWRAGIGYSHVGYELGEQFEGLGAVGSANVLDMSLSYPLIRSRETNVVGRAGFVNKKLSDDITTTRKRIRAVELGASFESRDAWRGGGYSGGSFTLQSGTLADLNAGTPQATPDVTPLGRFNKVTVQLSRLQALKGKFSLFLGGAAQWAGKNLDNAEKFTLGGDKGVRAYPAAEASSDQGLLLNAELRYWVSPLWSTYVFYDMGNGQLRKQPDALSGENKRSLRGAGIGVQYTNPELFTLKASLAVRGSEPVQSEEDSRSRLLVQVQRSF